MSNKIIEKNNQLTLRLDGAYLSGNNYFVTPFINQNGDERYFGKFKFQKPDDVKATLQEAVKILKKKNNQLQDTIFGGQYPKWVEDAQYGKQLNANNKFKFFREIGSNDEVSENNLKDYTYALEVHLSITKNNDIFLRVARAIVLGKMEANYNDELFNKEGTENNTTDISEDDLPF